MPFGSPGDVHINVPLTNVALAFTQNTNMFVASRAFPNVQVTKQSDLYYVFDRAEENRDEFQLRAPATESAGATMTLSTDSYFARKWALHYDIADEERANADAAINLDAMTTRRLMFKGMLKKEKEFAAKFLITGVWAVDWTGEAATPATGELLMWGDANSTPIEDISAASTAMQIRSGYRPNKFIMGQQVRDKLIRHPDIIDLIKYGGNNSNPAVVTDQTLAAVLGIEKVMTMGAVENTAKEGLAESNSLIGGKSALLIYTPAGPSMQEPSAGYTYSWTGYLGNAPNGVSVNTLRVALRKADRVEAEMAFDMKKTSADLGTFFSAIVA